MTRFAVQFRLFKLGNDTITTIIVEARDKKEAVLCAVNDGTDNFDTIEVYGIWEPTLHAVGFNR